MGPSFALPESRAAGLFSSCRRNVLGGAVVVLHVGDENVFQAAGVDLYVGHRFLAAEHGQLLVGHAAHQRLPLPRLAALREDLAAQRRRRAALL